MSKAKRPKQRGRSRASGERRAGFQAGRWLIILDRLYSSRSGVTVRELTEEFDCHKRTIYRDFAEIEEWLRLPLVTEEEPGGGMRYKLMDGSRFRPTIEFLPSELLSLLAAWELLAPLRATPWGAGLDSLQKKLKGRLSPETVRRIEDEATELAATPATTDLREHAQTVDVLMRAVRGRNTVEMKYHSLSAGKTTKRKLDPYRLWFVDGALYVVGACHVHAHQARTFAVDRIEEIRLTNDRFTIPKDFEWERYTRDSFRLVRGGEPMEVVVDFAAAIAPIFHARKYHPTQTVAKLPDGGARVTLRVAGLFEVQGWIAGFGSQARVVAPPELVRAVKEDLARTAALYERPAATSAGRARGAGSR